jgi:tetratricopeptide (TPR) repeat protein
MASIPELLAKALDDLQTGHFSDAEQIGHQIIGLEPDNPKGWLLVGIAATQLRNYEASIRHLRRAVELDPVPIAPNFSLGVAFQKQGLNTDAIRHFLHTIVLKPNHFEAIVNLAAAYQEELRLDQAAIYYERSLQIKPDSPEAHCNYAVLKLLKGDFPNGWPEFESRWQVGKLRQREFAQPAWNGEPLDGRPILLYAEQGFGDTMQFIRFAPMVQARGGRVITECQPQLKNLLTRTHGIDQLFATGEAVPTFDVRVPLLSLPRIFGTTLETIPAHVPYIHPAPDLVVHWQRALANVRRFRIGINWHGRVGLREAAIRDIPLGLFTTLAKVPNVSLISLQKADNNSDLGQQLNQMEILNLGEIDTVNGAFMDTAAIMMNLDLVITSDTSIAHLAGALGVKVWVPLPFVPDWRWLLDRSDSPWYPTMRLFRQKSPGDWAGVFGEIRSALSMLVV